MINAAMHADSSTPVISRLQQADRAWQRQRALAWLLRGWKWAMLAIVLVLAADVVFHLDARGRIALDVAIALCALGFGGWLVHHALIKTNPPERTARLLEERSPELGSQLINLLQLREKFINSPHDNPLTRVLASQAVGDAAAGVRDKLFLPLTKEPEIKRFAWHALIASGALLLLAFACLRAFGTTIIRFLDPLGDHPPYSMTKIWLEEPAVSGSTVLYRGSFMVKARWSGHDPGELHLTAHPPHHPELKMTLPMVPQERGLFIQRIENVQTDLVIHAHTKSEWSTSRAHPLTVILTPQFGPAEVTIRMPAYTGIAEKKTAFAFSGLTALSGSEITFTLHSNRPLKEGLALLATGGGEPAKILLQPDPAQPDQVRGSFIAGTSGRLQFELADAEGIPSDAARSSPFTVTHDLPPTVGIAEPARDGFVVEGFPLAARATASDDYGLKSLRVHAGRNGTYAPPVERTFDTLTREDAVMLPLMSGPRPPVAGDVITLFAEAMDTFPKTHVTRSGTRTLTVITRQEYQDYLRQEHSIADLEAKYAALFQQQRDLIERQKALAREAAKLAEQEAKKPGDPALAKRREELQRAQDTLNEELMKSAERMENFVADSPLYDVESNFGEQLKEEAQQVRDSIAQNKDAPRGTAAEMARAAQEHHERMAGKEEEARQQVEKAIADLSKLQELVNDFNHFQALYAQQNEVTSQAEPYDRSALLSEADQLSIQSLGATERDISGDLHDLAEKIHRDIANAKELFPKASASARQLVDAMEQVRMDHLGGQASAKMLRGDGPGGHQGAERLLQEMRALFDEAQEGQEKMSDDLDTCLKLTHGGMKSGSTMKQMMQCRKFGFGRGSGIGPEGAGLGGFMSGNNVMGGANVYGAESGLGRLNGSQGDGQGPPNAAAGQAEITKSEMSTGPAEVNRASDSVPAATLMEQYRSLTEAYFNRITGQEKPAKNAAQQK